MATSRTDQANKALQDNQAQMAQLQQQINTLNNYRPAGGMISETTARQTSAAHQQASALTNQYNALQARAQSLQQGVSGAQAQDGNDEAKAKAEANQQRITGLAQGGVDRLKNDGTDSMVRDYLQKQMGNKVLDPNSTPFGGNVPQYNAQGYKAQGYDPTSYSATTGSAAEPWKAAQQGDAPLIGGGMPWDATTKGAYMTDATDAAAGGEAARNQLIRDAVLQSGGNASDPSLAGAYAESLSQRNGAQAQARNQLNMRANIENFQAQRQADLANQGVQVNHDQFNASNQQQANASNASLGQQMNLANMNAQNQAGQFNAANANQAGQFNAANANQAGQFNASANNQAGMVNTNNQIQGRIQDFAAGTNARTYNQGVQSAATAQLGNYNNQRQGMQADAEGRVMNVLGQQVFRGPETQVSQPQVQYPSFQQAQSFQIQQQPQQQTGNYGYQAPRPQTGLTGSIWAGSGRPSTSSGMTTSSFGPGQIGNPFGAGAMVGTGSPAVNPNGSTKPTSSLYQNPQAWGNFIQKPGVRQPISDPNKVTD